MIRNVTENLVSLGKRQFVDCATSNYGWNGGIVDDAFSITEVNAIFSKCCYKYTFAADTCETFSLSLCIKVVVPGARMSLPALPLI